MNNVKSKLFDNNVLISFSLLFLLIILEILGNITIPKAVTIPTDILIIFWLWSYIPTSLALVTNPKILLSNEVYSWKNIWGISNENDSLKFSIKL